jgi:hypothetical protein
MTEREVENRLGMPPADNGRGLDPWEAISVVENEMNGWFRPDRLKYWRGRDWEIGVAFDEKGIAVAKELGRIVREGQPGILDRFRSWLGW